MRSLARLVVFALAFTTPLAVTLTTPLAAQRITPAQLHGALIGRWTGTLEYKDYSPPYGRVTLPTIFEIAPRKDGGVMLHAIYDDGPGKTVTSDDRFILSADGATLDWTGTKEKTPEIFRVLVLSRDVSTQEIRLVGEWEGADDNKPATIRETITLAASALTVLKEVRFTGGTYSFRHEYRMTRASVAP